jgi:hypothetical protein
MDDESRTLTDRLSEHEASLFLNMRYDTLRLRRYRNAAPPSRKVGCHVSYLRRDIMEWWAQQQSREVLKWWQLMQTDRSEAGSE